MSSSSSSYSSFRIQIMISSIISILIITSTIRVGPIMCVPDSTTAKQEATTMMMIMETSSTLPKSVTEERYRISEHDDAHDLNDPQNKIKNGNDEESTEGDDDDRDVDDEAIRNAEGDEEAQKRLQREREDRLRIENEIIARRKAKWRRWLHYIFYSSGGLAAAGFGGKKFIDWRRNQKRLQRLAGKNISPSDTTMASLFDINETDSVTDIASGSRIKNGKNANHIPLNQSLSDLIDYLESKIHQIENEDQHQHHLNENITKLFPTMTMDDYIDHDDDNRLQPDSFITDETNPNDLMHKFNANEYLEQNLESISSPSVVGTSSSIIIWLLGVRNSWPILSIIVATLLPAITIIIVIVFIRFLVLKRRARKQKIDQRSPGAKSKRKTKIKTKTTTNKISKQKKEIKNWFTPPPPTSIESISSKNNSNNNNRNRSKSSSWSTV